MPKRKRRKKPRYKKSGAKGRELRDKMKQGNSFHNGQEKKEDSM